MTRRREGERELGLLAARELADLPIERDVKRSEAGLGLRYVETGIERIGHLEHRLDAEMAMERSVLRDEGDLRESFGRTWFELAEDPDRPGRRRCEPDRQMEQRRLAGPVGSDQCNDSFGRDRERALLERPVRAVPLAERVCFDDVHAIPFRSRAAVARALGALKKIPHRAHEERHHPVLVEARRSSIREPSRYELLAQRVQLGEPHGLWCSVDEGAPARPTRSDPLVLQLPVGLLHGVRVDRERGDHVLHARQLVTYLQEPEPERVLDLVHELEIWGDARAGIEPERDRRGRRLLLLYYVHR